MAPRLVRYQLAALGVAWFAALIVVAWLLNASRQAALGRAERATAALATSVEQQTVRTYQAVNLTLAAIADAHHLSPRPAKNDPQFQLLMERRRRDLPFIRAIFVVDADGWIIHDTDYPNTPPLPLADRDYFREHRARPSLVEKTWPPLLSRSGTGWFLPVTRRLGDAERFEGVVVAAMQAEQFGSQFDAVPGDLVAIFHEDGTLVATTPAGVAPIGKSYRGLPLFAHAAEQWRGHYWTEDGLTPGESVVSFRRAEGVPFIVRASRSRHAALEEWRRSATGAAIAMATLTLLIGWFVVHIAGERRRAEREREQRLQAEKMEALGQLTGGIAHDLRNVLNVVSMNVEILRLAGADAATREQALGAAKRAVEGGTQLIDRLLGFARKRPLSLVAVDLQAWLEAARPLLAQAAGNGVELSVAASPDLPSVQADPAQLDSAVVNLVVNARDAMAGAGRIEVRAHRSSDKRVCLTIRDSGPGMPEAVRRRAPEPFYTTKGEAGTGLGLSQVYGFMQQIGGDMAIESAPGAGTAVHLYFAA